MGDKFVMTEIDRVEWCDGEELFGPIGRGVRAKILMRDPDDDRVDYLIMVPAGTTERAHVHAGQHVTLLLEGRMDTDDATYHAPAYVYGPADVEHGPFHYPVDCTLFGSMRGYTFHVDRTKSA